MTESVEFPLLYPEPRDHVFQSRGIDPLQRIRQLDATLHGEVAEMVVTHGSVPGVAHGFLNRSDVVGYEFTSLVADL